MRNKVELVFENIQTITLMISNFDYGLVKNLNPKYENVPYQLSYILIPSSLTFLEVMGAFGETMKVGDRLVLNDLSSVFIDGVEFKTYWDYEDDSQYNVLQHDFLTDNGDLLITWG